MRILAIETSCDETAAAIVEEAGGQPKIITNIVASQIDIHKETGGVIPEVAARMHAEVMPAVLGQATKNKTLDFDAVAVTIGPGLIGSLLIGLAAAKTIAQVKNIPFYAVNHLEGHIYSAWLEKRILGASNGSGRQRYNNLIAGKDTSEGLPELPALILIVSGGHTELILMKRHLHYQLLGATRDDAAGEAFDKIARLLDLGYPGGPAISQLAVHGKADEFDLPIALPENDELDFSFSGLKAAVALKVSKMSQPIAAHTKADIATSFQDTVAKTLVRKTLAAIRLNPGIKSFCLVGGVAANTHLRTELTQAINQNHPEITVTIPLIEYCTDNAAMIGAAAIYRSMFSQPDNWYNVQADPSLGLGSN